LTGERGVEGAWFSGDDDRGRGERPCAGIRRGQLRRLERRVGIEEEKGAIAGERGRW
jgi:hypothetical protein